MLKRLIEISILCGSLAFETREKSEYFPSHPLKVYTECAQHMNDSCHLNNPFSINYDMAVVESTINAVAFKRNYGNRPRLCPVTSKGTVYVGLTTMPDRMDDLHTVLDSLMQSVTPITVIVAVPYYSLRFDAPYPDPPDFSYLERNEHSIKIYRSEDYGPITKLLGPLEYIASSEQPLRITDSIIVLDDDLLLTPFFACDYLLANHAQPNSVFTRRGRSFTNSCKPYYEKMSMEQCSWLDNRLNRVSWSPVDVLNGVGSFFLPGDVLINRIDNTLKPILSICGVTWNSPFTTITTTKTTKTTTTKDDANEGEEAETEAATNDPSSSKFDSASFPSSTETATVRKSVTPGGYTEVVHDLVSQWNKDWKESGDDKSFYLPGDSETVKCTKFAVGIGSNVDDIWISALLKHANVPLYYLSESGGAAPASLLRAIKTGYFQLLERMEEEEREAKEKKEGEEQEDGEDDDKKFVKLPSMRINKLSIRDTYSRNDNTRLNFPFDHYFDSSLFTIPQFRLSLHFDRHGMVNNADWLNKRIATWWVDHKHLYQRVASQRQRNVHRRKSRDDSDDDVDSGINRHSTVTKNVYTAVSVKSSNEKVFSSNSKYNHKINKIRSPQALPVSRLSFQSSDKYISNNDPALKVTPFRNWPPSSCTGKHDGWSFAPLLVGRLKSTWEATSLSVGVNVKSNVSGALLSSHGLMTEVLRRIRLLNLVKYHHLSRSEITTIALSQLFRLENECLESSRSWKNRNRRKDPSQKEQKERVAFPPPKSLDDLATYMDKKFADGIGGDTRVGSWLKPPPFNVNLFLKKNKRKTNKTQHELKKALKRIYLTGGYKDYIEEHIPVFNMHRAFPSHQIVLSAFTSESSASRPPLIRVMRAVSYQVSQMGIAISRRTSLKPKIIESKTESHIVKNVVHVQGDRKTVVTTSVVVDTVVSEVPTNRMPRFQSYINYFVKASPLARLIVQECIKNLFVPPSRRKTTSSSRAFCDMEDEEDSESECVLERAVQIVNQMSDDIATDLPQVVFDRVSKMVGVEDKYN